MANSSFSYKQKFAVRTSTTLLIVLLIMFLVGQTSIVLPQSLRELMLDFEDVADDLGVPFFMAFLASLYAFAFFAESAVRKAPQFQFLAECAIGLAVAAVLLFR